MHVYILSLKFGYHIRLLQSVCFLHNLNEMRVKKNKVKDDFKHKRNKELN